MITGNVIIEASSIEAATELARACPVFEVDGSVEVWPLPNDAAASAMTMREDVRRRELA